MDSKEQRRQIIVSSQKAVDELIKVIEDEIITGKEDDLSADKLKNAAATKKLAIFDAFDIVERIDEENKKLMIDESDVGKIEEKETKKGGFAEQHARK